MFPDKRLRQLDKDITKGNKSSFDSNGDAVINVKINNRSQILSQFNYDSDDKLNPEFSEYLWDKSNLASLKDGLEIKIHTDEKLNESEVATAIKNHYAREYAVAKKELTRSIKFSLAMLLCGLVSLALTFLIYSFNIDYIGLVMEIVAWVFLWECADTYFIERARQRRECIRIQKLYSARLTIDYKKINKLS